MKILIVEGSPLARRLISEELQPDGFEVREADSAAAALALLTTESGFDLMTLGVVLPDADGFELLASLQTPTQLARLKAAGNAEVPAIFVTANDTDTDRLRGFQVGAADFVQKPWPRGHLLRRIREILGQHPTYDELHTLVVDDSAMARGFVRQSLARLGVTVHEADDGDTALAFLQSNPVDLVITDLNMARMNGDMLCLKIRSELGLDELPVIFFSASDDKRTVLSLFKMGATDYVTKPFLQEELLARLRGHLERIRLQRALAATASDAPASPTTAHTPTADADLAGTRVLVAEDSPVSARVIGTLLERLGCAVVQVANGEEAVAQATAPASDPFDLVFMDLEMPVLDGLDATRRIRSGEQDGQARHAVPIVALTAHDQASHLATCLEAGMNDFLVKPVAAPVLARTLRHWVKPRS